MKTKIIYFVANILEEIWKQNLLNQNVRRKILKNNFKNFGSKFFNQTKSSEEKFQNHNFGSKFLDKNLFKKFGGKIFSKSLKKMFKRKIKKKIIFFN